MSRKKLGATTIRIIMYKPALSLGLRGAIYGGHMSGLIRLRGRREKLMAIARCPIHRQFLQVRCDHHR